MMNGFDECRFCEKGFSPVLLPTDSCDRFSPVFAILALRCCVLRYLSFSYFRPSPNYSDILNFAYSVSVCIGSTASKTSYFILIFIVPFFTIFLFYWPLLDWPEVMRDLSEFPPNCLVPLLFNFLWTLVRSLGLSSLDNLMSGIFGLIILSNGMYFSVRPMHYGSYSSSTNIWLLR